MTAKMLTEGIKEQWNMMKVKKVEWLRGNDGKEDGKKEGGIQKRCRWMDQRRRQEGRKKKM